MQLTAGTRLGPYEILQPLGRGGMGEVWKARDTRLNRIVAIKRLLDQSDRFEREARAIAALNHPHICQIYDIGPDYLVLEYVEGETLDAWLTGHGSGAPAGADDVMGVAIQIAGALEEAHRHQILHRDLKPGNVMVTRGAGVPLAKILDFGLATLVNAEADSTRTVEGHIVGTAAYMSPEQVKGLALDARSDVFSLGAVLYEMFERRPAFRGGSMVAVLNAVVHDDVPALQGVPPLDRIVRRCL